MLFPKHLKSELVHDEALFRLHKFYSSQKDAEHIFYVVPSIFNKPSLMFLPNEDALIDNLLSVGHVYLMEWKDAHNPNVQVNDYGSAVLDSMQMMENRESLQPIVIAHSFGCIITSIAISTAQAPCKEIIFLAPPWDFTKYRSIQKFLRYSGIYILLNCFHFIHTRWLQIVLYLLNPLWILHDIKRYYKAEDKVSFWDFKKWQFSGLKISTKMAKQLIDDFIGQGAWPHKWLVNEEPMRLKEYTGRISIIAANKDKIIPLGSTENIRGCFHNSYLYKIEAGHAGCITGSSVGATFSIIKKILCHE